MIGKENRNSIEGCQHKSQRILVAIMKTNTKNLIGIYAWEVCKPEEERVQLYEEPEDLIDGIWMNEIIITMGDLNARIGDAEIVDSNQNIEKQNGDRIMYYEWNKN